MKTNRFCSIHFHKVVKDAYSSRVINDSIKNGRSLIRTLKYDLSQTQIIKSIVGSTTVKEVQNRILKTHGNCTIFSS